MKKRKKSIFGLVEKESLLAAIFASFMALALFGVFYTESDNSVTGMTYSTIRVISNEIKQELEQETAALGYKNSFFFAGADTIKPINININQAEFSVISLFIKPEYSIRDIWVNVSTKLTHPEVNKIIHEIPYQFFEITGQKLENQDLEMEITFRVAKWWMTQNYVYDDTIELRQFKENSWKRLITVLVEKSDEYYLFKAKTDSLGDFAITGRKEEPIQMQQVAEKTEPETRTPLIFEIGILEFSKLYWQFLVFPLIGLIVFFAGVRFIVPPVKGFFAAQSAKRTIKRELQDYLEGKTKIILNERRKIEILVEYIKRAREHRSDDWIIANAILGGWPRKLIEKAYNVVNKRNL